MLYANRSAAYLLKGLAKYADGVGDAEAAMRLHPEYPMGYLRKADFLPGPRAWRWAVGLGGLFRRAIFPKAFDVNPAPPVQGRPCQEGFNRCRGSPAILKEDYAKAVEVLQIGIKMCDR